MTDKTIDPIALAAFTDYGNALSIAKKYWPNGPAEVIQAAAATVLIHMKELRKAGQPQAVAPRPAPAVKPVAAHPAEAGAIEVPACPKCGGAMWDNREGKKNPKAPDFKCRDKSCVDEKGFVTSLWLRDLKKNTAYAQAHAAPLGAWDKMPEAIAQGQAQDDSELPF